MSGSTLDIIQSSLVKENVDLTECTPDRLLDCEVQCDHANSIDVMSKLICGELQGIARLADLPDPDVDNTIAPEEAKDSNNSESGL